MPPTTLQVANAYQPQDPRLGRMPEFDIRSLAYPILALLTPRQLLKPRSYTWNSPFNPNNQTNRPACTGFSVGEEIQSRPKARLQTDAQCYTRYKRAQQLDYWPGEDYAGSSVLGAMKAAVETKDYIEYRWALPPDPLMNVIMAVAYKGPGVAGTTWTYDMMHPDSDGRIHPTGGPAGGHAYHIYRVDNPNKRLWVRNTWGTNWGVGGKAYLTYDDFEKLLYDNGEFCIPVVRL